MDKEVEKIFEDVKKIIDYGEESTVLLEDFINIISIDNNEGVFVCAENKDLIDRINNHLESEIFEIKGAE